MDEAITGTLELWYYDEGVIVGHIYGDTKGRFVDGYKIYTTKVSEEPIVLRKGSLVHTRNSIYRLGVPGVDISTAAVVNELKVYRGGDGNG